MCDKTGIAVQNSNIFLILKGRSIEEIDIVDVENENTELENKSKQLIADIDKLYKLKMDIFQKGAHATSEERRALVNDLSLLDKEIKSKYIDYKIMNYQSMVCFNLCFILSNINKLHHKGYVSKLNTISTYRLLYILATIDFTIINMEVP